MTYKELFTNLKIPLAQTSSVFVAMFTSIASVFDTLQNFLVYTINQFFISTCSDVTPYAKERGLYRAKDESEENFRKRVLNAFHFLQNASTRYGMEYILNVITSKEFIIIEPNAESFILGDTDKKLGINTVIQGDELSPYLFFLVAFSTALTTEEYNYISEIIHIYKPAHIGFSINAVIDDSIAQ